MKIAQFTATVTAGVVGTLLLLDAAVVRAAQEAGVESATGSSHGRTARSSTVAPESDTGLVEVVVTATRTEERISKVPLSISAYDQAALDGIGAKSIGDIVRLTPGVTYDDQDNKVTIRGVASFTGAGTTGIYIDDTPIQVRQAGMFANDARPGVFDIERVEVLRGPQGTLFGAGSMGGTVRYIFPTPSLTRFETYGRAEAASIENGGQSGELGLVLDGPLVEDKLGLRLSASYRKDGGWIDRINRDTGEVVDKDANWGENTAVRAAATWQPVDSLRITPSVLYQNRFENNAGGYEGGPDAAYEVFSDPSSGKFAQGQRIENPGRDESTLSALNIQKDFDDVLLISNTSYYDRTLKADADGSLFDSALFGLNTPTGVEVPGVPDWDSYAYYRTDQTSFAQEIRLQSTSAAQRLRWVVGGFYSWTKQENEERFMAPKLGLLTQSLFGATVAEVFGVDLVDGIIGTDPLLNTRDEQLALFGEVNFDLLPQLTLTAGLRASKVKFKFDSFANGPYNGGDSFGNGGTEEKPVTPKLSMTYRFNDANMVYATFAEGFRIGGANRPVPAVQCADDLAQMGLTESPRTFDSDSLKSYEIGAKNRLFDNHLEVSSSVYYIDWSKIQQSVSLPGCGWGFATNLGTARSTGFDLQSRMQLTSRLSMDVVVGYTDAKLTESVQTGGTVSSGEPALLVGAGDRLRVAPWTANVIADYRFQLAQRDAYLHGEYFYSSEYKTPDKAQDPRTTSFDPDFYTKPSMDSLNLRAGMFVTDALEITLFVNNVLNDFPINERFHLQGSPLFFITSVQPRTYGVTVTFRP